MYGSGTSEIYYQPEKYGLVIVGSVEEDGLSYEFNIFSVWLHEATGRIFYGQDSGCSCPSPFEDTRFESVDDNDLTEVTKHTFEMFEREAQDFPATYDQKLRLTDAVKALLK